MIFKFPLPLEYDHFENRKFPLIILISFSVVQSLSPVQLFVTPRTAACQAVLSFTVSWTSLRLMSIELVMLSSHLVLCCPLLLSSIFPNIMIFSKEYALCIRCSKYQSFSISPSNEYSGLISLRLTDLISLQSIGLSKVFSSATIHKHQFFYPQSPLWSNSHIQT